MTKEQNFKTVMATIATVYDKALTTELIQIYWGALSFARPEHLAKALNDHIADEHEGRFMPKPAHLIGYIRQFQAHDKRQEELAMQITASKRMLEKPTADPATGKRALYELRAAL